MRKKGVQPTLPRVINTTWGLEAVMAVMKLARPHKGVVFDLADTLLWGKGGHWKIRAKIYRRVGRLQSGISRDVIFQTVNKIRREKKKEERKWPPALYWPTINALALQELDPRQYSDAALDQLISLGWAIRQEIQDLHRKHYWYPPEMGKVLARLDRGGIPFFLGSNHEGPFVYELLDEIYRALGAWFPDERRFTPETPKVFIHKPNAEFMTRIAERIGIEPSDLVYVGNSPSNDAPMVESGAQVILLDKDDHYRPEIEAPEFQEEYRDALQENRLIILRRPKDVADTLIAHYEESK